jgi:hypothetical protein
MAGPQFAQSFNADDQAVVSFETVGDALGQVEIGVGVIGKTCGVHGESAGNSMGTREGVPDGTGVHGRGELKGVYGDGPIGVFGAGTEGVYGRGQNQQNLENTTGVLGQGFEEGFGVTGVTFASDREGKLGHRAGIIGVSNADSERDHDNLDKLLGAGVVGLSLKSLSGPLEGKLTIAELPDPKNVPDGDGTGVWGASGGGTGVHGESQSGRGGVFESQRIAQLRLVPRVNPIPKLPAIGEFGDLYAVLTQPDTSSIFIEMYLCVSPGDSTRGTRPMWAPFQFGPMELGG